MLLLEKLKTPEARFQYRCDQQLKNATGRLYRIIYIQYNIYCILYVYIQWIYLIYILYIYSLYAISILFRYIYIHNNAAGYKKYQIRAQMRRALRDKHSLVRMEDSTAISDGKVGFYFFIFVDIFSNIFIYFSIV